MGGLSESAIIMVVMAMGMDETLHRSPQNAESFRIKQHMFRLVPPDGGLLVHNCSGLTRPNKLSSWKVVGIKTCRSLLAFLMPCSICWCGSCGAMKKHDLVRCDRTVAVLFLFKHSPEKPNSKSVLTAVVPLDTDWINNFYTKKLELHKIQCLLSFFPLKLLR